MNDAAGPRTVFKLGAVLVALGAVGIGARASASASEPPAEASRPVPSTLRKDPPLSKPLPDLRGAMELRRDRALILHLQRLARLDALAEAADQAGRDAHVEWAENVRRREMQRHHKVMLRIRDWALAASVSGRAADAPLPTFAAAQKIQVQKHLEMHRGKPEDPDADTDYVKRHHLQDPNRFGDVYADARAKLESKAWEPSEWKAAVRELEHRVEREMQQLK